MSTTRRTAADQLLGSRRAREAAGGLLGDQAAKVAQLAPIPDHLQPYYDRFLLDEDFVEDAVANKMLGQADYAVQSATTDHYGRRLEGMPTGVDAVCFELHLSLLARAHQQHAQEEYAAATAELTARAQTCSVCNTRGDQQCRPSRWFETSTCARCRDTARLIELEDAADKQRRTLVKAAMLAR